MKASIPKGTRDFGPEKVLKRNYIFETIKSVFKKFGYHPLETPSFEKMETLTGKYGDEGDNLLFKILNSGDFLNKVDDELLSTKNSRKVIPKISKKGLRYDLTVPFARYVVMHQNEISFPFKRYQIQPVWRADRPQKGRYQEFYQCDVDVVGSNSLMYEAELVQIYDEIFYKLGINACIRINNRKILSGIAEVCGISDQFIDMTVAIDKLDKIGEEKVLEEMEKRGISSEAGKQVLELLEIASLDELEKAFGSSEMGKKGVAELRSFHSYFDLYSNKNEVRFDAKLARGLSYYTGCIFEVEAKDIQMGSIGGGGRYDDLTGVFGLKGISGVGVSIGAERIYDLMEELNLFPEGLEKSLQVLIVSFDQQAHSYAFKALIQLREAGICSDLYPSPIKMQKQMKYANDIKVPQVIIIGDSEMESGKLTIKNMQSGTQDSLTLDAIIQKLG